MKTIWNKIKPGILPAVVALFCVVTTGAWLDRFSWVTFQFAQFRLEWAVGALLLSVFCILRKRTLLAIVAGCALVLNAIPLTNVFGSRYIAADNVRRITLLQMNVMSGNTDYAAVRDLISKTDPDILLIEELTPLWQKELQPVLKRLRFALTEPREDTYGIGVFSTVPLIDGHVLYFGPTGHPSIECGCNFGSQIRLLHTHLQGPVKYGYYRAQLSELEDIVRQLRGQTTNALFCGDMNTMSSVAPFFDAMRELNLTDSRIGYGMQLSWPTPVKSPIPLLTIDHVFVGSNVSILERRTGPNVGSDHYPVIIRFSMKDH